ncbi:LytTR family DNA-binding domain-containing protein [Tamlana sp. 2201CG12-4]|uniref:LytR/AlgR family response regulator transcription factor n=1 Tax=Tamlana sp. 2201CG12-4 TaxID=3112582 RepID=UPI002DB7B267|nr:LytTR family DNA-binding domain-containing protein [Tamlana sp. 2201CG12-4]MEC3906792.1 LytTR family DNA-binding domain-containing protein [Tamlana sp. 2201CG12-4]
MKVVIVEDEIAASENLTYLINTIDPNIEILTVLDSVKSSVDYFSKGTEADLIFMDIHLADGISFEIFEQVSLSTPVIFTTAYDQYAIKAFKVNSIDYLLKPINEEELEEAINKFKSQSKSEQPVDNQIEGLMQLLQTKNKAYKTTYLVHHRDELLPIKTEDIAYFYIETGIVKGVTFTNKSYIIDKKLEDIESELNPELFYRINRQFIINRNAVANIKFYFNGKLIVNVNPPFSERIVVSKAKASDVKNWMNL